MIGRGREGLRLGRADRHRPGRPQLHALATTTRSDRTSSRAAWRESIAGEVNGPSAPIRRDRQAYAGRGRLRCQRLPPARGRAAADAIAEHRSAIRRHHRVRPSSARGTRTMSCRRRRTGRGQSPDPSGRQRRRASSITIATVIDDPEVQVHGRSARRRSPFRPLRPECRARPSRNRSERAFRSVPLHQDSVSARPTAGIMRASAFRPGFIGSSPSARRNVCPRARRTSSRLELLCGD